MQHEDKKRKTKVTNTKIGKYQIQCSLKEKYMFYHERQNETYWRKQIWK